MCMPPSLLSVCVRSPSLCSWYCTTVFLNLFIFRYWPLSAWVLSVHLWFIYKKSKFLLLFLTLKNQFSPTWRQYCAYWEYMWYREFPWRPLTCEWASVGHVFEVISHFPPRQTIPLYGRVRGTFSPVCPPFCSISFKHLTRGCYLVLVFQH